MSAKLISPKSSDMKFKGGEGHEEVKAEKYIPSTQERGRLSTQESEEEFGKKSPRKIGLKSGTQGESSGAYDKEGHHLKSDGTPDMRFKENREEFGGQGYEYTSPIRLKTPISQLKQEETAEESQVLKSGRQGEFSGQFDKQGHHLKASGTPDMRFKENRVAFEGKGYEYASPRRLKRQISPRKVKPVERETRGRGVYQTTMYRRSQRPKSRRQGEFGGEYDEQGHHLKYGGTPDMRFKENREEFKGQGYEYVSPRTVKRPISKIKPSDRQYDAAKEKPAGVREMGSRITRKTITTDRSDTNIRTRLQKSRENFKTQKPVKTDHIKSDGTPDMRFKENRDSFSGQDYENITTRKSPSYSKANLGIAEGNLPGEHVGKFDSKGHHLKQDGTPDMRFQENRLEFSGQGFESPKDQSGNTRKSPRYLKDEDDIFADKIYYRRKRPPTPYAIYIRENASHMKKLNPDMDMNEVFRELADKWRKSSDKEHQKYYDIYDDEVQRFEYSNQYLHRGPLAYRKFAQEHGLKLGVNSSYDKRAQYDRYNRQRREEFVSDEQNVEYENRNPNRAETA